MLLTAAIILGLVSTFTEIKLVQGSKTIDRLYTDGAGPIKGIWFNTIGSFGLAALLGLVFAADGLTVMLGGSIGVALSQAYFTTKTMFNRLGISWAAIKSGYENNITKIQHYGSATIQTIKTIISIITAPVRATRWAKNQIRSFQS